MKVVAFNGSPRAGGNTEQLIEMVFAELRAAGIAAERIDICKARPRGCTACMQCAKNKDGRCALTDDPMNEWIAAMRAADGILLASPTYFANVSSEMKALIDRAGFVAKVNGDLLKRKVGAAIVAVRRGGALPTYDALNHFFGINQMLTVGSSYWNHGIGLKPGDVQNDDEGKQTMKNLGQNLAWVLKAVAGAGSA